MLARSASTPGWPTIPRQMVSLKRSRQAGTDAFFFRALTLMARNGTHGAQKRAKAHGPGLFQHRARVRFIVSGFRACAGGGGQNGHGNAVPLQRSDAGRGAPPTRERAREKTPACRRGVPAREAAGRIFKSQAPNSKLQVPNLSFDPRFLRPAPCATPRDRVSVCVRVSPCRSRWGFHGPTGLTEAVARLCGNQARQSAGAWRGQWWTGWTL